MNIATFWTIITPELNAPNTDYLHATLNYITHHRNVEMWWNAFDENDIYRRCRDIYRHTHLVAHSKYPAAYGNYRRLQTAANNPQPASVCKPPRTDCRRCWSPALTPGGIWKPVWKRPALCDGDSDWRRRSAVFGAPRSLRSPALRCLRLRGIRLTVPLKGPGSCWCCHLSS